MKSAFIEVYDDVIPIELQNHLLKISDNNRPGIKNQDDAFPTYFKTGASFQEQLDDYDYIWYNVLYHDSENTRKLSPYAFPFFQVLYKLCDHLNIILHEVNRMIYYHQPPSIQPKILQPHTDKPIPHWVCLYYLNDSEGDTIFYDSSGEEINRVSPKKGRIAFFDGLIVHSGSRPTSNHRKALNINFTGEFINNN